MRWSGAALLTLCCLLSSATWNYGQEQKDPLPVVSYPQLGKMVRGLKGKVIVVYFWASY